MLRYLVASLSMSASSLYAAQPPPGVPEPEGTLIEFQAPDASPSVELRGILGLPKQSVAGQKPPAVMMIWGSTCDNGTGWVPASDTASGKDEAIFLDIRNAFLKGGIAVFTYTKRGCSPLHGGTADKSILVTATRKNRLADAAAAFRALEASTLIDPSKLFVFGHSEGNTYAWELGRANKGKIRGLLLTSFISGRYIAAEYHQQVIRRLEAFDLVDERHSGKVTKDMLSQYPCFVARDYLQFDKCDSNHDGILTALEFRICRERRWLNFLSAVDQAKAGQFVEDSKDPAEWYRESYAAPSMVETIGDQGTPVALFQGEADTATPLYEAAVLKDALTEAKKPPFYYKTYPGLSHGLAKGTGRNGHCEKFGPVDAEVLHDLVAAAKLRL